MSASSQGRMRQSAAFHLLLCGSLSSAMLGWSCFDFRAYGDLPGAVSARFSRERGRESSATLESGWHVLIGSMI